MTFQKFIPIVALGIALISCANNTTSKGKASIGAKDFDAKIKALSNEQVLDVRTPEEYNEGHIAGAQNINWNGGDFENAVTALSKENPVMVYCLSGGRSAEAAHKLEQMGFQEIYELNGGMMQWKVQGLAVEAGEAANDQAKKAAGMTKAEYDKIINSKANVLIDFYADWCKPCKQMEPMLKQLADEQKDKLEVVRINADDNEDLSQLLGVDALPFLMMYQNGKMVWQKKGLTPKEEILTQIK